ncbi:hypothetical protein [Miniphocaeibacter massiliensis]|uniref:hypothetical protein n=1 Tax=Miniphocaeibacter massiliensis TaxID=2041841 RepID=UPI000C1C74E6|nr:hypothetical protein [Miniphocaeibacter massiliensis]
MKEFDIWCDKLHEIFDYINNKFNCEKKSSEIIVISGLKNSGKSRLVKQCIDNINLGDNLKNIGSIIKITAEEVLMNQELKTRNKPILEKVLNKIEITVPSVELLGVKFSIDLQKKILDFLNNKKINIIWFEDVTANGLLSVKKVEEYINEFEESSVISIITTEENRVSDYFKKINKNTECFYNPIITFSHYIEIKHKLSEDSKTTYETILKKLKALNDDKKVEHYINLSNGSYGNLEYFLKHKEDEDIRNIKEDKDILKELFLVKENEETDIQKSLLLLLSMPIGIPIEWFDTLFQKAKFDYINYLENLKKRDLVEEKNNYYSIKENIPIYVKNYTINLKNKKEQRLTAKLIDFFMKKEIPENYFLRFQNAKLFDGNLAEGYNFIYILRNNSTQLEDEFINEDYSRILKILKNDLIKDDKELLKIYNELSKINIMKFPTIISAEITYHKLKILLECSYNIRKEIKPKIKGLLYESIKIFYDLIESYENEMLIKLGILLAPEIINYLSFEEISDAKKIYKIVEEKIFSLMKSNYSYYKYYDVIRRGISTSIVSYRKSSYELWSIINEFETEVNDFLDYDKIIPMIFSNLLGISFYLDIETINDVMGFYERNKKNIDNYTNKNYKIKNNILLSKFLLNYEKKELIEKFSKIKDKHVSAINYAGMLFYSEDYENAYNILDEILKKEKTDDFYIFFCQYNKCLIDIVQQNDNNIAERIDELIVPSLFTDSNIVDHFIERKEKLLYLYQNYGNLKSQQIDLFFSNNYKHIPPIFCKAWSFSDYQYWS